MNELSKQNVRGMLERAAAVIEEKKEWLCELDGVIGDADHGVTMATGFKAVSESLASLEADAAPTAIFNTAAKAALNAMGGSAGPLLATAFMRAGASAKGKDSLDAAAAGAMVAAMAEGIQARGKAEPKDKTMLDAWLPASAAAKQAVEAGKGLAEVLQAAARGAQEGAEATKDMQAVKGRAARLGERSRGHIDPGAASAHLVLEAFAAYVSEQ